MNGSLIDTNVISEFVKPEPSPKVKRWFEAADPNFLFVSVVTLGEIRLGLENMPVGRRRAELERWFNEKLPQWFDVNLLDVTKPIANQWAMLIIAAKRNGLFVATADGLIAATAIHHNLALITRNLKDFTGLGITIVNPWQ